MVRGIGDSDMENDLNQMHAKMVAVVAGMLLLAGCTAAGDGEEAAASKAAPVAGATAAKAGSGVIETEAGRYVFTPTTCAMGSQDGVPDIEVQGPGTAPDGEKVFVEFSSTADALTIKLGVDRAFSSPDRSLKAGHIYTQKMPVEVAGSTIRVPELELVDDNGTRQSGNMRIDC